MARKNIRITDEAYNLLKSLKKNDKESFCEVILENYPISPTLLPHQCSVNDDYVSGLLSILRDEIAMNAAAPGGVLPLLSRICPPFSDTRTRHFE